MTKNILAKICALFIILIATPAIACPIDFANDYMADPNGVADSTPNWNQAMADQVPCLQILGLFRFYSSPDPITNGAAIVGLSITHSQLVRDYDGGTFISIKGLSGWRVSHLAIVADEGTTGGLGLNVEVGPEGAAAAGLFDNLTIQGWGDPFGTFAWPIHIWGDGGPLPGWRDGHLRNVTVFGYERGTIYCRSCTSVKITGLSTHGALAKVWFSNPWHVTIAASDLQGPIQINGVEVLQSMLGDWKS